MAGWDWTAFRGSAEALRYNKRDLPTLDRCIARCRGRHVAVQAGGNLGIFPKRLAEVFEDVYCFEPASDLFATMMHNAPEPNILRFQAVLGDARRLVGLSRVRRDGKPNAHEGITHVSGDGNIPTLRIDDLALDRCDLIQLDLEGWEIYALRGAIQTITRCKPVLCIEINKSVGYLGIDPDAVRDVILGYGYQFVERLTSDEIYVPADWSEAKTA